jgi:WD40 repeat protein
VSDARARRVNDLFGRSLEVEPGDREAFLERACGRTTREEVLRLLRAHDEMGGFLEEPAAARLDMPAALKPGFEIGSYRIVRRVGAGGGGTVYEAEQRSPRRRVALKIRHAALGSSSAQHRFREEAEILARLDHPDVAHVYEAGVHQGLPWFAMEFVADARNIVDHARSLDPRARLRLFARVCDAVHHGHRKGIVHRDLKPGNILVRPDGQPKIIDFGIAQADGAAAADGELAGTPAYMSPEQCVPGGPDVDVRSDVYSLGVVLHEILTGRLPHDVTGLPVREATRRVREEPHAPPPPDLPADLRAVLGRALEPNPTDRYPSAAYLAEEVRRFLAYEPVAAARGNRIHHARLFVRRNPAVVASVAALVVVLAAGVAVSTVFAYRAIAARDREREEANIARLAAAHAALRSYDVPEARRLLGLVTPDMRRFEWNYLAARLDRAERTWGDPDVGDLHLAPWRPGSPLVAAGRGRRDESTVLLVFDNSVSAPAARRRYGGVISSPIARDDRGGRLAWGTYDGWVVIVDAVTLDMTTAVQAYAKATEVRSVAFSPDGVRLVVSSRDADVVLCDPLAGAPVRTVGRVANEARFSPDGTLIALATKDNEVEIWDAADPRPLRTLTGHESRITAVHFDGERIVTASTDGTARIWDAREAREIGRLVEARAEPIHCADLSPDGKLLLTGHQDGTVTLWDTAERRAVETYWGHEGWVKSACFAGDGRALTSARGTVKEWRLPREDRARLARFPRLARDVEYSPDGRRLACAVFDRTVRLFDLSGPPSELVLQGHDEVVQAVAFRPDGGRLASVSADGGIRVWDAETGELVRAASGGDAANLSVSFSPDGRRLVTAGRGGARILDAGTGEALRDLPATSWAWAALFTRDGRRVAVMTSDAWLRVWDVETGAPVAQARANGSEISCATFTADGRTLVTGGGSRVDLWDAGTFRLRATHELPAIYIQGVAPSPDGTRIAVGSWGSVRLIDAATGRTTIEFRDHRAIVWDVAFHPGGEQFASAAGGYEGQGCEARLWGRLSDDPWPPALPPAVR